MAVDMTLDPDTVRMFVRKARLAGAVNDDTFEDGHEGDVEFDAETLTQAHHHEGLVEEEDDDMSAEELVELIDDLNVDEAAELVAIAWIGRGDFEAGEFATAIREAEARAAGPTSKYLIGMPMLADYLEAGLDALEL